MQKNVTVIVVREMYTVGFLPLRSLCETCAETANSRKNSSVGFCCVVKGRCYGECFMIPAESKKESNCSLWLLRDTWKARPPFVRWQ